MFSPAGTTDSNDQSNSNNQYDDSSPQQQPQHEQLLPPDPQHAPQYGGYFDPMMRAPVVGSPPGVHPPPGVVQLAPPPQGDDSDLGGVGVVTQHSATMQPLPPMVPPPHYNWVMPPHNLNPQDPYPMHHLPPPHHVPPHQMLHPQHHQLVAHPPQQQFHHHPHVHHPHHLAPQQQQEDPTAPPFEDPTSHLLHHPNNHMPDIMPGHGEDVAGDLGVPPPSPPISPSPHSQQHQQHHLDNASGTSHLPPPPIPLTHQQDLLDEEIPKQLEQEHPQGEEGVIQEEAYKQAMASTGVSLKRSATSAATGSTNRKRSNPAKTKKAPATPRTGGEVTYVLRIHEMLEDSEKEGNTKIVSWQKHGRCFRIHKQGEFIEKIMPRYFKAKMGSFQRWLRAWGFVRMTEGKDRGSWYHRYFVRGVTDLCKNMTRQQMQSSMVGWPPAGQVPDFYVAASGSTLSEQPHQQQEGSGLTAPLTLGPPGTLQIAANPKRLRGTILEDLRSMLDDLEENGETDIASWAPHGKAFKIHKRKIFEETKMAKYFKTARLTHLSDTLRIWGFVRFKQNSADRGAYYHKFFVKGDPSLCRHRTRIQMRNSMTDWDAKTEVNLYAPTPLLAQLSDPELVTDGMSVHNNAIVADGNQPIHQVTGTDPLHFFHSDHVGTQMEQHHHEGAAGFPHFDPGSLLTPAPYGATGALQTKVGGPPGFQPGELAMVPMVTMEEPTKGSGSADATYVLRVHEMLEDSEKEGNTKIVSWQPHGRCFRVHNQDEFIEKIMPRYFKAKMGSFQRWLRAWGFVRMTEGKDRGSWYHRYFVRGVTDLCKNMTRQEMQKAMEKWLPSGHVPNFYSSGSGSVLSEVPIQTDTSTQCVENPKKLRGVVCEEVRAMLEDAEEEQNTHILSWQPHGRAFRIHKKKLFAEILMSRYFKATKYTYFSDTLRIWGFCRIKTGRDKGGYFHKLFVRGQPQLTRHLSRFQMKESMVDFQMTDSFDLYEDFTFPDSQAIAPTKKRARAAPPLPPAGAQNAQEYEEPQPSGPDTIQAILTSLTHINPANSDASTKDEPNSIIQDSNEEDTPKEECDVTFL